MAPKKQALKILTGFPKTAIALAALLSIALFPIGAAAVEILMGTDAAGTFSHFAGRAISRLISQHADDLDCRVLPAPDRIHNLTNLQGGSLDMALVDGSRLYDAANRKGDFEFLDIRYDNLAILARVYDQAIVLVVRGDAGIESLDQLKGKRINVGPARSRTQQAMELIVAAKGWTLRDFRKVDALSSSQSQDSMAFCHGSVQAMLHIGVHPDSTLEKLIRLCDAVPVGMDDADMVKLIMGHPGYSLVHVPAAAYPAVGHSVATLGTPVALVASGSLDDGTVKEIMTVLSRYGKTLHNAHPAMATFAVNGMLPDVGIALHPGAAAYLGQ
jgi:TRAP transporter TAXI family solute receptor